MPFIKHANDQLILSAELLALLKLILENESHTLEQIVKKTIKQQQDNTLIRNAQSSSFSTSLAETQEEIQTVIFQLFSLLERTLQECMQEQEHTRELSRLKLPSLAHINYSDHDSQALARSIAKAQEALKEGPEHAREVLYRELLKQWYPLDESKATKN